MNIFRIPSHNKNVITMFQLNIFLIFSILGYTYESIYRFLKNITQKNLLFGPWFPIYGFGLLIAEGTNRFLNKFKQKGLKKIIWFFLLNFIFLTILEEIGGLLVEKLFFTSYWNYEDIPLHIGPYINIYITISWTIAITILDYFFIPILTPYIKKIPRWVSFTILFLMIIDHIYLIITHF